MSDAVLEVGDGADVDPESVVEFLEFRVDGDRYAMEVGRVGQVVWRPATTRVPRAPAGVYGAATVEGDVVVALDTYEILGLERPFVNPEDGYLVLLNREDTSQPVGFLVEAVDGIRRRHVDAVVPTQVEDLPLEDHWFRATVVRDDDSDVHVFDGAQFLVAVASAITDASGHQPAATDEGATEPGRPRPNGGSAR